MQSARTEEPTLLEMQRISKQFPGVRALNDVSFSLRKGEVHALLGENGAGKSTLMKILCGVYHPDAGEIRLRGERVAIPEPAAAQALGIATVHQEGSLFPGLSVAENIYVGRQPVRGALGLVDWQALRQAARQFLQRFDLRIDPATPVRELSVAHQQIVEIAKALSLGAQILILDEPTSALAEGETARLFDVIRELKGRGLAVVYISHRLEEIFEIADRATVLRDGALIGAAVVADTTPDAIVRMMVGREVTRLRHQAASEGAEALRVEHLSADRGIRDVSFRLCRGEIVGLAGLIGSGRTELAKTLFGALPQRAGRILVDGQEARIRSPKDAMRLGIAYLSEDRRAEELFLGMSVRANLTVNHLSRLSRLGFVLSDRERASAQDMCRRLDVRTPSVEERIVNLSGGNQQKTIVARWLAVGPKILIADEPTRGIDVGAKAEIYALLNSLAAQGLGILFISSELPEVIGLSHRVIVMNEGQIAGILSHEEATEERIMALCSFKTQEPIAAGAAD